MRWWNAEIPENYPLPSTEEANYWGDYPYMIEDNYFNQGNLKTKPGVYRQTTVAVGSFEPNALGLYDMRSVASFLEITTFPVKPSSCFAATAAGGSARA